jgi:multiple sugar transport system permease protein
MTTESVRNTARVGGVEVTQAWVNRRRVSFAILIYSLLIFFAVLFMGPLLMAALSSLKTDALETPPRILFEQLSPRNWGAAWTLGQQSSGNPWVGGARPGANMPFYATYLVPQNVLNGETPKDLLVNIPRLRPGAGAAALGNFTYASDYVQVKDLKIASTEPAAMPDGKPATRVRYEWRLEYDANAKNVDDPSQPAPEVKLTPMTLEAERGYIFESATLSPSRLENPQASNAEVPYEYFKIQSYVNVSTGVLTYVFRNYFRIFEDARSQTTGRSLFLLWIFNSFIVVILKTIMTLFIASMAGYAIARLEFPGKGLLFVLTLFIMTVPGQVTFISNYLVLKELGLLNSVWGLTISGIVVAGQVFFMKQFFETLPKELEEAAKIDGATPFQTFWKVILPLTGPAMGALTITTAQGAWNEYFWALIVLQQPQDAFTLPIGLNSFNRLYGNAGDQGLILAGAIVSAIPVIILFAVFQRYFVSTGASSGGKE